jgi:hypothetical protein
MYLLSVDNNGYLISSTLDNLIEVMKINFIIWDYKGMCVQYVLASVFVYPMSVRFHPKM